MRHRLAKNAAALLLLLSAVLVGCATGRAQRAVTARREVLSAAVQAPPPSDVKLASFEQNTLATDSAKSPSDQRATEWQRPAEVIVAPDAIPLESDRPSLPLDLPTALGLTQGQNPRVAFAQAQIAQSLAVHDAARALWLPSIRAGMNYNKHENRLQDVEGNNIQVSRGAAFGGFGANAVGASSPGVPGVYAYFHTTDAIFQRRITGYALEAREFQATAVTNDQLLETALAYLALLEAAQRKAIAAETLEHGQELVKLTGDFAQSGAGNLADADRATAALALLKNEMARAEEAALVASARVAQQLSSDPSMLIVPQETNIVPIDLVPLDTLPMGDLVATGLTNRPELSASRSLVCEAVNRLRREENAPWLPSILLGVSYGGFGAGVGGQITNGGPRLDFDGVAWWELRNLGFGEHAARDNARAQIQQARMQEVQTMDLVAREIVETYSQVQARKRQIASAQEGITAAQHSYERNLERIRNVQGLPIEVLQSIQALDAARREYLRAVVDYNTAQFRLHRSLGWPVAAG
jgi:outer membrane protein TolC